MNGAIALSATQVALATSLILANATLSWVLSLGLGKRLLVASARTVVQLLLLGYLLVPIFHYKSFGLTAGVAIVMVGVASVEGLRRLKWSYAGATWDAFVSLCVSALSTVLFGTILVVQVHPWWQPQYFVPLLGMILGNALTGLSLGLDRYLEQLTTERPIVEASLSLGATPWEASRPVFQAAVRTGLIPILNSMSVVGLVTIPGMMTGQLLAGSPPALAARYQIVIMFLIACATALGVTVSVFLASRRMFDEQQRLREDVLQSKK